MPGTARPATYGEPLSARELQILTAAANGLENAEIGRQVFLSAFTVKSHLQRAYRKLGARDRAHAVALALTARLIAPADITAGRRPTAAASGVRPTAASR
jgi:DNA-binding NarL/FixJ family response regulator